MRLAIIDVWKGSLNLPFNPLTNPNIQNESRNFVNRNENFIFFFSFSLSPF